VSAAEPLPSIVFHFLVIYFHDQLVFLWHKMDFHKSSSSS
jgi:hypothetical protein